MTKYRQTFTVEGSRGRDLDPNESVLSIVSAAAESISFAHAGEFDRGSLSVSWTAPESVIEAPTGIGAVVLAANGPRVRIREETTAQLSWYWITGRTWNSDADILELIASGAEIKSYGIEL